MSWFIRYLDSSIGKKLVMAVTGLFLYIYLIIHLAANLFLLRNDGGVAFNTYAEFMGSGINIPIRIIEIVLFLAFAYHILNGIRLWFINKSARQIPYKEYKPSANSTFYSRFMIQSGIVVFIFLVLHLMDFFIPYRFSSPDMTMYQSVVMKFNNTWWSIMYIAAMVLLHFTLFMLFRAVFRLWD